MVAAPGKAQAFAVYICTYHMIPNTNIQSSIIHGNFQVKMVIRFWVLGCPRYLDCGRCDDVSVSATGKWTWKVEEDFEFS